MYIEPYDWWSADFAKIYFFKKLGPTTLISMYENNLKRFPIYFECIVVTKWTGLLQRYRVQLCYGLAFMAYVSWSCIYDTHTNVVMTWNPNVVGNALEIHVPILEDLPCWEHGVPTSNIPKLWECHVSMLELVVPWEWNFPWE